MEPVLSQLFNTYVLVSGVELGISEHTQYLNSKLLGLTSICRNSELFHKYRFDDPGWCVQHIEQTLDIQTFFEYYGPKYDLAYISSNNFNDCLEFFKRVTLDRTPFIYSRWDMGTKRDYTFRAFDFSGEKSFLYYRDPIQDW